MKSKSVLKALLKLVVTVAIFVGIFAEFGGGPRAVSPGGLRAGEIFYKANPAMPGIVGKIKAKIHGQALPEATVPVSIDEVCRAAAEGTVFVRSASEGIIPFKALRHCAADRLDHVYAADGKTEIPLASVTDSAYVLKQGKQLVPMDMKDLWAEIKRVQLSVFLPWFLFAMLVKLAGIYANILRWQVLLAGQGIRLSFRYLTVSYFVGRYFGIVTPSTMGLDGWRLYDTIRLSRKPVECATALGVERVIGLVGLLAVILGFMPFTDLAVRSLGELMSAMVLPLFAAVVFAMFLLLKPTWFAGLPRLVPSAKARGFLVNVINSATAYSSNRGALLLALGCAVFGQLTTMFMYFGNAMALQVKGVPMAELLYASAVMTLGTFLAPSASGEGVRELVFVALLGGRTTAAKAFLIGHLGFWIEKLPLSIPGGFLLMMDPDRFHKVTQEDLARLRAETLAEQREA